MIRSLAGLFLAMAVPALALAQEVRAPDQARLDALEQHLGGALRHALAEGAPEDVRIVVDALSGVATLPPQQGDWNCRIAKLGGLLPLTVYRDFRCRITERGDSWIVQKITGSQRFKGTVRADGGDYLFLGVGHVGDAPATDYAGLPPNDQTPVEPNQTTAEIGVFEQVTPDRARLLLPAPLLESEFDLILFSR